MQLKIYYSRGEHIYLRKAWLFYDTHNSVIWFLQFSYNSQVYRTVCCTIKLYGRAIDVEKLLFAARTHAYVMHVIIFLRYTAKLNY